jgi:23S rRNA (uracil1939-C5)-methyltransferase
MKKKDVKPYPVLEQVHIIDTGSDGLAIGKLEQMVILVKDAVPGDIADVLIYKKKNKLKEGRAIKFTHLSDKRTKPVCQHFGTCGGCKWQNMQYNWQLFYKQKQVSDALTRIAKIELPAIENIIPSKNEYYYRNKLEFTFSNKKWLSEDEIKNENFIANDTPNGFTRNALGFHMPGKFDKILDIENCHLQPNLSNSIRNEIKDYALKNNLSFFDIREQNGLLRNIMLRNNSKNEWMLVFSFFYNDEEAIKALLHFVKQKFPEITSLHYVINSKKNDTIGDLDIKLFSGDDGLNETMENFSFKISPKSFYQTNSEQAYQLYKITREYAQIESDDIVYDLYTGTGTIANFVAPKAKKVIGLEYVEQAIKDAIENSKINHIANTEFYAGDIKDLLNDTFIEQNGKPDIIITDPPRAGMHADVINKMLHIAPKRIVYVSCNPATQARDLQLLSQKYRVDKVQPIDMFPQTHHVENIVLLEKI